MQRGVGGESWILFCNMLNFTLSVCGEAIEGVGKGGNLKILFSKDT